MPWTVRTRQDSPWPVQIFDEFGEVTALMASNARALAAELVRAADEGEPVERSCFTCRHNTQVSPGRFDCPASWEGDERVDAYAHASGSFDALDGMPTNRALSCPGHAPKVTT